jgi:hypothetical protein
MITGEFGAILHFSNNIHDLIGIKVITYGCTVLTESTAPLLSHGNSPYISRALRNYMSDVVGSKIVSLLDIPNPL